MAVDQIKRLYESMPAKLDEARRRFGRPLTLAEKILVAHADNFDKQEWSRGKAQLRLRVDRVALQDATGQMALLQFMQAGKKQVAVPSTVHCDHLIRAQSGARRGHGARHQREPRGLRLPPLDLEASTASASGSRAPASSTRWCSRTTPSRAAS